MFVLCDILAYVVTKWRVAGKKIQRTFESALYFLLLFGVLQLLASCCPGLEGGVGRHLPTFL